MSIYHCGALIAGNGTSSSGGGGGGGSSEISFDDIYPVGSVYISLTAKVESDLPPVFRANGRRWIRIEPGKCLWSSKSDNSDLNKNIHEGLPTVPSSGSDHNHSLRLCSYDGDDSRHPRAGNSTKVSDKTMNLTGGSHTHSGGVYGKSDHVQPEALGVTFWKRISGSEVVTVKFFDFDGTVLQEQTAVIGDEISQPSIPAHSGLTFSKWSNGYTKDSTIVATWDMSLTAIYSYEVVPSSTSYVTVEPSKETTYYTDQTAVLSVTVKNSTEGSSSTYGYKYYFTGWDNDESSRNMDIERVVDVKNDIKLINSSNKFEFKANSSQEKRQYITVTSTQPTYSTFTGTGTYDAGQSVDIKAEPTTTTEDAKIFRFGYWGNNTSDTSNPKTIIIPNPVTTTNITYKATFIAMWRMTFALNNGKFVDDTPTTLIVDNNTVSESFKPKDPVRDGYDFVNWYSNEAMTTVYNWTTKITNHKTIYAKWSEKTT